jgi:hypothetical protein
MFWDIASVPIATTFDYTVVFEALRRKGEPQIRSVYIDDVKFEKPSCNAEPREAWVEKTTAAPPPTTYSSTTPPATHQPGSETGNADSDSDFDPTLIIIVISAVSAIVIIVIIVVAILCRKKRSGRKRDEELDATNTGTSSAMTSPAHAPSHVVPLNTSSVNPGSSPEYQDDVNLYHTPDDGSNAPRSPRNAPQSPDPNIGGDVYAVPQKKKHAKLENAQRSPDVTTSGAQRSGAAVTTTSSESQASDSVYNVLNFHASGKDSVGKANDAGVGGVRGRSQCSGVSGGEGEEGEGESSVYSHLQSESEDVYNQVNRHNARRADVVEDEYSRITKVQE